MSTDFDDVHDLCVRDSLEVLQKSNHMKRQPADSESDHYHQNEADHLPVATWMVEICTHRGFQAEGFMQSVCKKGIGCSYHGERDTVIDDEDG